MLSGRASRTLTPRLHRWAAEYLSRVCHVEEISNTNSHMISNADNKNNTSDNNVTKREELVLNNSVPTMESLPALQKVNVNNIKCCVVNDNSKNVNIEEITNKDNSVNESKELCNRYSHMSNFESSVKQELFNHLHWRLETRLISKQNTQQQHERIVNQTVSSNSDNSCYDTSQSKSNTKEHAQQIEEVNTSKKCMRSNINASTLQNRSNNYAASQTSSSSLPQMHRLKTSSYNISLQELNDMLIKMVHHRKDVFVKPAVGCATMMFVCNQIISSIMRHAMQFATSKLEEIHQQEMSNLECAKEATTEEDEIKECVHNTKNHKSCIIANSTDKFNESNERELLALQKNKANVELESIHYAQEHPTRELFDNFTKSMSDQNVFCSSSSSNSECIEGEEEDDSVRLHVIAARYSLQALTLPAIQTELRKTLWGAAQSLHRKIVHECKVNLLHAARRERSIQYNNNNISDINTMQIKFITTTAVNHTTEMKFAEGEGKTAKRFIESGSNTNQLPEEMNNTEQTNKETINKTGNNKTYREIQREECEEIKEINSFLQHHYKLSLEQIIDDLFTFPISLYNITPERLSDNSSRLSVSLHNSDKMLFYPPLHRVYFDFTTRSTLLCGQMRKPRADKLLPLYFATSTNLSYGARNTQCNSSTQVKKEHYNYNKSSEKSCINKQSTNLFCVQEWRDTLWVSLCEMSQLRICISFLLQLEYILFDAKQLVNCSVHATNTENKESNRCYSAKTHGSYIDKSKGKEEERHSKEQNKESTASTTKVNGVKAIDCVLRLLKLLNARLDGHLLKETHFRRFCRKCQISERSELSCISSEEQEREEQLQNTVIDKEEDNFTCNASNESNIVMPNYTNREQICNDMEKYKQHEQIHKKTKPDCTVRTHYASVQELHTAFMHAIKGNNSNNSNDNNITPESSKISCNFAIKDDYKNVNMKYSDFTNIKNIDNSNNESSKECCNSVTSNNMFVKVKNDVYNADNLLKTEEWKCLELFHNKTITNMRTNTTHNALTERNNKRKNSESAMIMEWKQKEHEQQITTQRHQTKQPQNKIRPTLESLHSNNNNNYNSENGSKAKSRDDLFLEEILSSTSRTHQSWPSHLEPKHSSRQTQQATSSPSVTRTESQKRSTGVTRRINNNNANNKHCRRSTQHEENVVDKR